MRNVLPQLVWFVHFVNRKIAAYAVSRCGDIGSLEGSKGFYRVSVRLLDQQYPVLVYLDRFDLVLVGLSNVEDRQDTDVSRYLLGRNACQNTAGWTIWNYQEQTIFVFSTRLAMPWIPVPTLRSLLREIAAELAEFQSRCESSCEADKNPLNPPVKSETISGVKNVG